MNWSEFKKNKLLTATDFLTRKVNSSYRQSSDIFFCLRRGKYVLDDKQRIDKGMSTAQNKSVTLKGVKYTHWI